MAHGQPVCASCGAADGIEEHHLYLKSDGCPDDLTVWLCHNCHGRAHGLRRRVNMSDAVKAGVARARARGYVYAGRSPTVRRMMPDIQAAIEAGETPTHVARRLSVARSSVYLVIDDINTEAGIRVFLKSGDDETSVAGLFGVEIGTVQRVRREHHC